MISAVAPECASAGDEPLGPVGQQDGHAVAAPHAEREERTGELVHARLERRVAQPLVAENDGVGVGTGGRHLVEQRAERAAGRAHAQLPVSSTRASSDGGRVVEVMRRV